MVSKKKLYKKRVINIAGTNLGLTNAMATGSDQVSSLADKLETVSHLSPNSTRRRRWWGRVLATSP